MTTRDEFVAFKKEHDIQVSGIRWARDAPERLVPFLLETLAEGSLNDRPTNFSPFANFSLSLGKTRLKCPAE